MPEPVEPTDCGGDFLTPFPSPYGYEPLDGQLNALSHALNTTTVSFGYGRNAASQIQNLSANDAFYLPTPTTAASTSYAPNALNEYATVAGGTYKSDLNGNLLSWTPPGSSSAQTDTYDSENRLTSAVYGTTADTFDYDPLGRRIAKTYNGVTTLYLHDADEEIAEYSGSALSSGTLLRRYVTGPAVDDRITHIESGSTSPPVSAHTYYHVNHQGSVIAVTDYAGKVSGGVAAGQRLAYDEYGNLSSASNSTGEQFRFTGRRYDAETGLYYYRARYYSPQLGRFLQVDPIGYTDDVDLYTYVGNDPLDKTDPSGTASCDDPTGVGCPTTGTPQKTGTPGHDTASVNQMKQMVNDARAAGDTNLQGSYNQTQTNATGGIIDSPKRTDATLTSTTKEGDTMVRNGEIVSPSQTIKSETSKLGDLATQAAPGAKVQNYVESLSGASKAGGKAVGAAGAVIGLPGAIMDAIKNPNMSTTEFLYRATGMYDIGVATGAIPPPGPQS